MKHLLIATIARQCRGSLDTWYSQVLRLAAILKEHGWICTVSVAENDSTDGTAEWISNLPANSYGLEVIVSTQKLGTQQYGSVWSIDRLRNLATARQQCLDQAGNLSRFSKVAYIEVDVTYDPSWCVELVVADHPRAAGLPEPDIYSGWSLRSLTHPKESVYLYDTCATRAGRDDVCWDVNEAGGTWRGKSLVTTGLTGIHANSLHRAWSTFNCFCVYRAAPFAAGLRWGYVNPRLNASGIWIEDGDYGSGWLDCDTAIMCERFRDAGYGGIYLNTNCLIRHV